MCRTHAENAYQLPENMSGSTGFNEEIAPKSNIFREYEYPSSLYYSRGSKSANREAFVHWKITIHHPCRRPMRIPQKKSRYFHWWGSYYRRLGVGQDTSSNEEVLRLQGVMISDKTVVIVHNFSIGTVHGRTATEMLRLQSSMGWVISFLWNLDNGLGIFLSPACMHWKIFRIVSILLIFLFKP